MRSKREIRSACPIIQLSTTWDTQIHIVTLHDTRVTIVVLYDLLDLVVTVCSFRSPYECFDLVPANVVKRRPRICLRN